MTRRHILILLVAMAFAPTRAFGQAPSSRELSAIRDVAEDRRQAWGAPGLVFSVLRGAGPATAEALGIADVETGMAMDPGMLVSVASVSKLITATTAAVVARQGKVELTVPIRRYLPTLPPRLGALTLEQLLSHTAGLGEGTPFVSLSLSTQNAGLAGRTDHG
jgi:CubicO group peptidase (beta-lactamase class C family)